jgi:pentatricopeptide repeat protein
MLCKLMETKTNRLLLQEADLEPDVVVYNTLVSLAGQAGQLQRAMDTVTEMEVMCLR